MNHAVCFSNQRSHLNRNPVGSANKTIFKAMVTGCPSVEYASLTASNIAYHFIIIIVSPCLPIPCLPHLHAPPGAVQTTPCCPRAAGLLGASLNWSNWLIVVLFPSVSSKQSIHQISSNTIQYSMIPNGCLMVEYGRIYDRNDRRRMHLLSSRPCNQSDHIFLQQL